MTRWAWSPITGQSAGNSNLEGVIIRKHLAYWIRAVLKVQHDFSFPSVVSQEILLLQYWFGLNLASWQNFCLISKVAVTSLLPTPHNMLRFSTLFKLKQILNYHYSFFILDLSEQPLAISHVSMSDDDRTGQWSCCVSEVLPRPLTRIDWNCRTRTKTGL